MKFHYVLIALAAAACAGDTGTKSGDTGGTGTECPTVFTGPVTVDTASAKCDAADNITYELATNGLTGDGYVWAIESGNNQPWDEEHDITSYEWDTCGTYDHLNVTVTSAAADETAIVYERNVASQFTCEKIGNPATMTFAFAVKDPTGAIADCGVGGQDAAGVIAGDYTPINDPSFTLGDCGTMTVAI